MEFEMKLYTSSGLTFLASGKIFGDISSSRGIELTISSTIYLTISEFSSGSSFCFSISEIFMF